MRLVSTLGACTEKKYWYPKFAFGLLTCTATAWECAMAAEEVRRLVGL
jgi:hypothetical protein